MNPLLQAASDKLDEQDAKIIYLNQTTASMVQQMDSMSASFRAALLFERLYAAAKVLMNAKVPYVFGGESAAGADCSGFTQLVYSVLDIKLPRTSLDQSKGGKLIQYADLAPGDLIFFKLTSREPAVDHVAIYVGNGRMIHTNTPALGIHIEDVPETWKNKIVTIKRNLP